MVRWGLLTAALLVSVSVSQPTAQRFSNLTISVIATSDLHGGVLPRRDRGGLALLGGYVRNVRAARAQDGGGVLLVDSGDMFQGTLESNLNEGAAVVAAYNTPRLCGGGDRQPLSSTTVLSDPLRLPRRERILEAR
jgi:5'-nucleotidase